ncbi:MAG: hypothetical protein LBT29_07480 [Flavobacteriaceae bacterium]|jgi:hypothetical protein|nr:hypothetical protein [Flavobacteriaceae bacterium]
MRKIILGLIALTLLLTCQKESQTKENTTSKTPNFKVILEGVFTKNDRFQLFYASNSETFDENRSIIIPIYGEPILQQIVFDVPKNIKPTKIRLDFGENKAQGEISIKNISFFYKNDSINGDFGSFSEYFDPSASVVYNAQKLIYELPVNEVYDPLIEGNSKLEDALKKLYNKKPTEESK